VECDNNKGGERHVEDFDKVVGLIAINLFAQVETEILSCENGKFADV
jgi:hypothetical protein